MPLTQPPQTTSGCLVKARRIQLHLERRDLCDRVARQPVSSRYGFTTLSYSQLRRIEEDGVVPALDRQQAIAAVLGMRTSDIWPDRHSHLVAHLRERTAA